MVLRVSKVSSLKRMRRALSIMGRDEVDGDKDMSKFFYPAMQATDIYALDADLALGGMDQRHAHMLARDAADKLKLRKPVALHTPLLGSLSGPGRMDTDAKMSKSDPSDLSRINLSDSADAVAQKIRKAKTDPNPLPDSIDALSGRPEADNLISIYAGFAGMTREDSISINSGKQFSDFKKDLTDLAVSVLEPINNEMRKLLSEPEYIDQILYDGSERAIDISRPVMEKVFEAVGFRSCKRGEVCA